MRRGVGVARTHQAQRQREAYTSKGKELTDANISHVQQSIELFKQQLVEFARKHRKAINQDPEFRSQFQVMCSKIGVDPLASSKGFWAEILGIGDYYYELGVRIIHVAIATRPVNGGILDLQDLLRYLEKLRSSSSTASASAADASKKGSALSRKSVTPTEDDVKRAVTKLEVLGNGIKLIDIGTSKKSTMIVSVPIELNSDHTVVLDTSRETGYVTVQTLSEQLSWHPERSKRALETLLKEGIAWIDNYFDEIRYYFPSVTRE